MKFNAKLAIVPALDHDAMMLKKFGTKVSPNGRLERRIVANLIAHLEVAGFDVVGTWDGDTHEEVTDAKSAMEFIFNLDDCHVWFCVRGDAKRKCRHWVRLIMGNGIDIVSDWGCPEPDVHPWNVAMDAFDAEDFA